MDDEPEFQEVVRLPNGTVVKAPGLNEHHKRLKQAVDAEKAPAASQGDGGPGSAATGGARRVRYTGLDVE